MKDYFSTQSRAYAAYRPTYPDELYHFIFQHVKNKNNAWDCATGNGQVAAHLAKHFNNVQATDISREQLDHAIKKDNISYSVGRAERTEFKDHQFDLITVAQALHWFDRDLFYNEVRRVAKPGGILAVWGYSMLTVDPAIDRIILEFYNHTVGPFWDSARRLVEDEYRSLEFPFEDILSPTFNIKVQWSLDQLAGYLFSWSATQKFLKEKGYDPVEQFTKSVRTIWLEQKKLITFPIFSRIGTV
jgi:SAM-dependent methyltransferase